MFKLLALELENFQSIVEPTRIEFAPITLLYGPNSAGKSAVFDALELVRRVWSGKEFVEQDIQKLLRRWAHKAPPGADEGKLTLLSPRVAVEFEFEPRDPWEQSIKDFSFGGEDDISHIENLPTKVARLEVAFNHDPEENKFELMLANVSAGGVLWVSVDRSLVAATPSSAIEQIVANAKRFWGKESRFVSIVNSPELQWVLDLRAPPGNTSEGPESWEQHGWLVDGQSSPVVYTETTISGVNPHAIAPVEWFDVEIRRKVIKGAQDVMTYFSSQLCELLSASPPVVRADRRIPEPKDAQTFVQPMSGYDPRDATVDPNDPVEHLRSSTDTIDTHWRFLASAAYSATVVSIANDATWASIRRYAERLKGSAAAFDRVNGYLRDELFREKLYQLFCKASILWPVPNSNCLDEQELILTEPVHIRLLLRDGERREVDLHDVGSGLSFVLPVLGAIARDGVCQVQQPELHLHAALQGDMADVLIDRLGDQSQWQAIVETHSEHLLLRLLRRIRNSAKAQVAKPFPSSDLAIYYFDPQVTGGTVVARQAMTPLGEFYVNWPRGFFTDREKDLFDE